MVVIFTPVKSIQLQHMMEKIRYYIKVENLDGFIECICNNKILITYNDKSFDIPFIEYAVVGRFNKSKIRRTLRNFGITKISLGENIIFDDFSKNNLWQYDQSHIKKCSFNCGSDIAKLL